MQELRTYAGSGFKLTLDMRGLKFWVTELHDMHCDLYLSILVCFTTFKKAKQVSKGVYAETFHKVAR